VLRLALACVAAAAAASGHATDVAAVSQVVVERTNAFRASEGVGTVQPNDALARAAREFAGYLARTGEVSHTADGRQPGDRAAAAGYASCIVAENLASRYRSDGYRTAPPLAEAFLTDWQDSPGHRRNLADPDVTEIGVGVARDAADRYYAVQLFGRPRDAALRFSVQNRASRPIHYRAADQAYSLAAGATRTHMACRPASLDLEGLSPDPVPARPGTRYVVRDSGVTQER
jgi:uncharacterized protein YkwD